MEVEKKLVGVVCLFGEANAGKSSLLNKIIGKKVSITSFKPQTTRHSIRGVYNDSESQIVFVDTPGVHKSMHRGAMRQFIKREIIEGVGDSDHSVLVLDAKKIIDSEDPLQGIKATLREAGLEQRVPEIIVINKIDIIDQRQILPIISIITSEVFSRETTECIPVSAKTGEGIEVLKKALKDRLERGELLVESEEVSLESDEVFTAEIVREKAFLLLKQELPYRLGVVCRGIEDGAELMTIYADILVERSSQKAIVIGKGGEMLQKIGKNARLELERIYGMKVCLKLLVKVEERWTESEEGIRKLGYQRAV